MSYIFNQTSKKDLRRKLRKDQSSIERLFWSKIRNRQLLGFKFRRQYSIGPFITDFCCTEIKLVIELDGDSHYVDQKALDADKIRQRYIEDLGFVVLRFTNKEVDENIDGVVEIIAKHFNKNNLT